MLLHDGRIIKGVLSEEDGMIIVAQPIGAMRFPKKRIERVFPSMQEVYKYKLEQLPEDDFQERIKLARWCLEQKMEPEARQQLAAILERNPKHAAAKAMLVSLDQAEVRMTNRMRDPGIRQTGGEQEQPVAGDRPGTLDASVISGARRGMRISGLPVIFDLPPAQAVKRAEEFNRYVHPVLQTYCVRCHNERYDGTFQLIQIKSRIDRTPEAFRANLDATLRLIDRENPTRSELLSSSLRPHGRGPNTRPIFQGSNDKAYQILATWAKNLQSTPIAEAVVPAKFAVPGADSGESFASQRGRASSGSETVGATRRFVTGPVETKNMPPLRAFPGQHALVPEPAADPNEFPVPFAVGGAKPKLGQVDKKVPPPVKSQGAATPPLETPPAIAARPGSKGTGQQAKQAPETDEAAAKRSRRGARGCGHARDDEKEAPQATQARSHSPSESAPAQESEPGSAVIVCFDRGGRGQDGGTHFASRNQPMMVCSLPIAAPVDFVRGHARHRLKSGERDVTHQGCRYGRGILVLAEEIGVLEDVVAILPPEHAAVHRPGDESRPDRVVDAPPCIRRDIERAMRRGGVQPALAQHHGLAVASSAGPARS